MQQETIDLMAPRVEVIAPYPSSHLHFNVGDILTYNGHSYVMGHHVSIAKETVESYPHLFKKLQWWERREVSEMPEYVKYIDGSKVFKIVEIHLPYMSVTLDDEPFPRSLVNFLPATIDEYNSFIQNTKQNG